MNEAAEELDLAFLSYVFMPNHAHILLHPMREVYSMAEILQAMKQGPAIRAKNRGWIPTRLWLPGGGFDSNINNSFARKLATEYIHQNPVRKELLEDPLQFRWSSANWYVTGETGDVFCKHISELWWQ